LLVTRESAIDDIDELLPIGTSWLTNPRKSHPGYENIRTFPHWSDSE
jgi:hypothetical protein